MLTLPAFSLPMAAVTASVPTADWATALAAPSEPLALVPLVLAAALGAGLLFARHTLFRGRGAIGRHPVAVGPNALPAKA